MSWSALDSSAVEFEVWRSQGGVGVGTVEAK